MDDAAINHDDAAGAEGQDWRREAKTVAGGGKERGRDDGRRNNQQSCGEGKRRRRNLIKQEVLQLCPPSSILFAESLPDVCVQAQQDFAGKYLFKRMNSMRFALFR